jgi:pyruvate dehydrogenase E2 component (dihydrolipoamide acetyltransferase)
MVDVVMPQMGESLTEGTVAKWLKSEGDEVERDEAILEIETDKVNTVVEAPVSGVVEEIVVPEGETVGVGTLLARLAAADGEEPSEEPTVAADDELKGHFGGAGDIETLDFRRTGEDAAAMRRTADRRAGDGQTEHPDFLSPAVLDLASRQGVPIEAVRAIEGSGRGGRVSKRDLERWLEGRPERPGAAEPAAREAPPAPARPEPPAEYVYEPTPRDRRVRMSQTRKRIADHMVWSQRISAHVTSHDEADVSALVEFVDRDKQSFRERVGAPLTYTTVLAYAVVQVLQEFPRLNAAVVGDEIVERPYVHLGLAVATDDHELVVPVLTDADQLPFEVFVRRMHDLVTRARERRLELREMQHGTFTLTNPGVAGGTAGTPIINQPQVAILSAYAIRQRPWVVDGEVVPRPVMSLSVTFDHRIIDGVLGFRFLTRLIERLSRIEEVVGA